MQTVLGKRKKKKKKKKVQRWAKETKGILGLLIFEEVQEAKNGMEEANRIEKTLVKPIDSLHQES